MIIVWLIIFSFSHSSIFGKQFARNQVRGHNVNNHSCIEYNAQLRLTAQFRDGSQLQFLAEKETKKKVVRMKIKHQPSILHTSVGSNQKTIRNKRSYHSRLLFIGTTTTTTMFPLTKEICEDKHSLCCYWATAGECDANPYWMKLNCAKTCGTCKCNLKNADRCSSLGINCTISTSTTKTTQIYITSQIPSSIESRQNSTMSRVKPKKYTRPYTPPTHGFRRTRITTMRTPQQFSKTTTQKTKMPEEKTTSAILPQPNIKCKDYHRECSFWAVLGECDSNPFYMRSNCQWSCKACNETLESVYAPTPQPGCDNKHILCNYWAHIGECVSNSNYMLPNCRLSCRIC